MQHIAIQICLCLNDSVQLQRPSNYFLIIAAMPPVCPLFVSSGTTCPPDCIHCCIIRHNMSPGVQAGRVIPRTPLSVGHILHHPAQHVSTGGPASRNDMVTNKFTFYRSLTWSWRCNYEKQGGTWPYSSPKWQDYSLGG